MILSNTDGTVQGAKPSFSEWENWENWTYDPNSEEYKGISAFLNNGWMLMRYSTWGVFQQKVIKVTEDEENILTFGSDSEACNLMRSIYNDLMLKYGTTLKDTFAISVNRRTLLPFDKNWVDGVEHNPVIPNTDTDE